MTSTTDVPARRTDISGGASSRSLKAEVAKLHDLSADARAAADELVHATARLEEIDIAGRAREIAAAKIASL